MFLCFNQQPQSICTIEELSRVVVTREDDVTNSVSVFITPDKLITFSMEDRDANEFAIVLAGYYRLIVGKCIIVNTKTSKLILSVINVFYSLSRSRA